MIFINIVLWRVHNYVELKCIYRGVINAADSIVVFLCDHERSEIGSVAGGEEYSEECPYIGHEPAGDASRRVHVDRRSKQHRPDEPERTKQRKLVLWTAHITNLVPNLTLDSTIRDDVWQYTQIAKFRTTLAV